jgi:hypothetical protein
VIAAVTAAQEEMLQLLLLAVVEVLVDTQEMVVLEEVQVQEVQLVLLAGPLVAVQPVVMMTLLVQAAV